MFHLKRILQNVALYIGLERNTTTHSEKLLAGLGAFLGILTVYWVSTHFLDDLAAGVMVASMGASAVLLFAVPHGALSQPWSVVVGHLVSAVIGVACNQLMPESSLAPALAVGLSVGAMSYLRCIHPPGGATALTATIGGDAVNALGFSYVLAPILINVLSIMLIAFIFNAPFQWRRYPARLARWRKEMPHKPESHFLDLTHEDFAAAMQELNSLVDVTPDELARLFELAVSHAEKNSEHPQEIIVGRYYSNGQLGKRWSICQIIDASDSSRFGKKVIYKTVAGNSTNETGISTEEQFRHWARFEVVPRDGHWMRVSAKPGSQPTA
jgi:CBS domain-containing membrane protein